MNADVPLKELLTRAKLVDEAPRVIRQIQLKLDRVIKQHQRELSLLTAQRKTPKTRP